MIRGCVQWFATAGCRLEHERQDGTGNNSGKVVAATPVAASEIHSASNACKRPFRKKKNALNLLQVISIMHLQHAQ